MQKKTEKYLCYRGS